jgi:hypothetical protein
MELADLLLKIADNRQLNPHELDALRQFGRDIQINNAYLAGLKSGASSINAERINAQIISVGSEVISGYAARFYATNLSVSNKNYTDIPSWSETYNDGFSVSGSEITIPFTGRYIVAFQTSWSNSVSRAGFRDTGAQTNGTPDRPQDSQDPPSGGSYTYLNAYDEMYYNKGDKVKFTHYQDSGSTITLDMWVVFRLMRLGA